MHTNHRTTRPTAPAATARGLLRRATSRLPRPRGPRRTRLITRTALAAGTALAVVAAVVVVDVPADAATPGSLQVIAASLHRGTLDEDIASGSITVSQLVDADLAGWKAGGGGGQPAPRRADVVRQVTREVEDLRAGRAPDVPAELDVDATADGTLTASVDPLAASDSWKSFWHKVKHPHWTTLHFSSWVIKTIVGAEVGVILAFFCATPGVGALTCGLVAAALGTIASIINNSPGCIQRGFSLSIPDVKRSHCG